MDTMLLRAAHHYARTNGPNAPEVDLDASGRGIGPGGQTYLLLLAPLVPGVAVEVRAAYRITNEGTLRHLRRPPQEAVKQVIDRALAANNPRPGRRGRPNAAARLAA